MSNEKKEYQITAKQIQSIDIIENEFKAVNCTLETALRFSSNRYEELIKDHQDWWGEMAEIYEFDLSSCEWVTRRIDGLVKIVKKDEVKE